MARLRCAGLLAALLLGCGLPGHALEPTTPLANYSRQAWGMENGLPQNTVQALAQTKNGFIWLGTEAGLVRFDGNSFAVFDKNSSPALPGNDVRWPAGDEGRGAVDRNQRGLRAGRMGW